MNTLQVTEESFGATVQKGGIVLIDFWAEWCGPCRIFGPIFEAAAARHPDVIFGKVDTEAEPALAAAFQIQAIPTLMVLRDGVLLAAQPGAMTAGGLDALVQKVRELDMDDIKKQLAAQAAAAPRGAANAPST